MTYKVYITRRDGKVFAERKGVEVEMKPMYTPQEIAAVPGLANRYKCKFVIGCITLECVRMGVNWWESYERLPALETGEVMCHVARTNFIGKF